jgi:hypothetical protein
MKYRWMLALCMLGWLAGGAFSPLAPDSAKIVVEREAFSDTSTNTYCGWWTMQVHAEGSAVFRRTLNKDGSVRALSVSRPRMKVVFTNLNNGKGVSAIGVRLHQVQTKDNSVLLEVPKALIWRIALPEEKWTGVKAGRLQLRISSTWPGITYVDSVLWPSGGTDELCKLLE